VDSYNHRLQIWDSQYNFLGVIGGPGTDSSSYGFPQGISRFPDGRLVIADTTNNRIKILSPSGVFQSAFPVREDGSGNLLYPSDIACVSNTDIWMSFGNPGLTLFRYRDDGTYLGSVSTPVWLGSVFAISASPHGTVFVAQSAGIGEYSLDGEFLRFFSKRFPSYPYPGPRHIMTNSNGDIWVVDKGIAIYQYVQSDTTSPTSTHSISPSPTEFGWTRAATTLTITSTDKVPSAGFKELHYTVDSGAEQVTTETSKSLTFDDGIHQIAYWGVDNAGNIETTQYATVRIDKIRPVTTRTVNATDTLLTLTPSDNASGIAGTYY
jgi:hypothetical protein